MSSWKKLLKNETENSVKNLKLSEEVLNASLPNKKTADREAEKHSGKFRFENLKQFFLKNRLVAACLAVMLCACAVIPTVFAVKNANAASFGVMLEINPSVLFITDKKGNVTGVKATNSDADVILSDKRLSEELCGKSLAESSELFIDVAAKLGYIDLEKDLNAVKFTAQKDSDSVDESVAAAENYFKKKGVYSVVLKEITSTADLAEKAGVYAKSEKTFSKEAEKLPSLYGERNISDIEQAYENNVLGGLYDIVRSKIENITEGACLILQMKIKNVEIKLCTFGFKDYWDIKDEDINLSGLSYLRDKMAEYIAEYSELTGGKYNINSEWELNAAFYDYYALFGDYDEDDDSEKAEANAKTYVDGVKDYFDSLTLENFRADDAKIVALLNRTDLDTMNYETLTRVPETAKQYSKDLVKVLSDLYVSREKNYKSTYETPRAEISEEDYEAYKKGVLSAYGTFENFWEQIKK